jgi:hypothetical protein
VAEAAALLTWPHTNGGKQRSIKAAINLAIEEWDKVLHVYGSEIARLGLRIRRPNWKSVHKIVKDGRTAARTYERRGPPRRFSAEEERMLVEIRSERPVPNPMLDFIVEILRTDHDREDFEGWYELMMRGGVPIPRPY